MAAVYDEFGNFIYDDPNSPTPISEPDVDAMRYELAKAGSMPLRPGGSDVPYLASQVPTIRIPKAPPEPARPYTTATNVPQAIADQLGFTALPQAVLGLLSSFPAAVAKETGFPKVADAVQYMPTSRGGEDILEVASKLPQVATSSHMGVGPLAEYFVPRRAFGLQSRSLLTPDDIRVMGGRAIETGREIRNIPEDFSNAQSGVARQNYKGEPTYGARLQGVADDLGDVMARREMQGLSPIPGISDIVSPETRMYAVRRANAGQMIDPTDPPTARYSDQNRKVITVSEKLDDVIPTTDFDFPHNNSHQYYNAAVRDSPYQVNNESLQNAWKTFSQKKINEMFPDAPNDMAAAKAYENRFNQRNFALQQIDMLSDFSRSPEAESAVEAIANNRDAFIEIYNEFKNKPKEKKPENDDELGAYKKRRRAYEETVQKLELSLLQKEFMPELSSEEFKERIRPPNKEEYMRRAQAAKDYIQGTFKKDISKYIGTSQGPQMELAKRGITMAPKQELFEIMKQIQSDQGFYSGKLKELEKQRAQASLNLKVDEPVFNPKGEMYPLIVTAENDLKGFQTKLNDLNRQKSELRDLHRIELPDVPDPADNTGPTGAKYRALTNPISAMIDKVEQSKKHLENVKLANAYETISDIAYAPSFAKDYKNMIPFEESKNFFPGLKDTPDEAKMFNVQSKQLDDLGISFLAEMIVKNIMTGRIPLDEKGKPTTSLDKIVEQLTKPRIMEESMKEAEARKSMPAIDEYAQQTLFNIPPELRFKNASVLELTKDSTEDSVRRQTSFEGMVLDHCIAGCSAPHPGINPFSGENYDHSYPVDVATGKDRGDKKLLSSFMTKILKGESRMGLLRDNVTGLPSVTISMNKTTDSKKDAPKYNLEFASGYRNKQINRKYAEDVRDYLNLRSDIIKGSGDTLEKWGILDTQSIDGQRKVASLLKIKTTPAGLGLPRFVLENDVRKMVIEQTMGNTHADILGKRALLKEKYTLLSRERGENDPEVQDLASQITGLTAELRNISSQVATQGSPNLFRRMTSEALTNELYRDNTRGPVLAVYDNLISDDTYGLRDFWEDDFDFYPDRLRTFTNAVRNNENLLQAMTTDQEGYDAQMRERLARFQTAIEQFTPQQRELLVRSLDDFAETSISQQIDNLNPDDPDDAMYQYVEERPQTPFYLDEISRRRRGEDFIPEAQAPATQAAMPVPDTRERSINFLANDIVVPNAAFRDQTVQNIVTGINQQLLPSIERFNPRVPGDREYLEREIQFYQNSPLDRDLGQTLEDYIGANPQQENRIRESVADFMIEQINRRLGNQAPAQNAALGDNILRVIDNNRDAVNAAYPEEISNNFGLVHNAAQSSAEAAIRRNSAQIGADENPNEAYINEVGRQLRNLSRGRRTEERVASIPVIQEFYDDLVRAQARETTRAELERQLAQADTNEEATRIQAQINQMDAANQLVPEHIRGVITRDLNEMMMLGELNRAGSVLNRIFEGEGIFAELTTDEQRTAASDFFTSTLGGLLNDPDYRPAGGERATPPDIFADGIPGAAPPVAGNNPEAYRDLYTTFQTGSPHAFDQVMLAERMTPGAINLAIINTDGDLRYDRDVQRFYNVNSPAGISQLNNALRRYMEGNGFDVPPRPAVELTPPARMIQEALTQAEYNYPTTLVQEIRDLIQNIENEGDRFSTQPDTFIGHLRDESNEYANHNENYSNAVNELANHLEQSMREYLQTPATAPQLPAPAANPIDELERRYGTTPRAPIDIVTDGLNRPIPQFEQDYSEAVQRSYRQILSEIDPAVNEINLENAMGHIGTVHDIIESGDHEPARFDLTSAREMNDLSNLLDRHYEVFREFENLLGGMDNEPPEGRKRGGFIERGLLRMNKGSRVSPVPTATRLPSDHPHTPPVKPVVNLTDPGFAEELKYQIEQRQKSSARPSSGGGGNLTDAEMKNRLGSRNPTYNAGGKVSIDQMRYELLRK